MCGNQNKTPSESSSDSGTPDRRTHLRLRANDTELPHSESQKRVFGFRSFRCPGEPTFKILSGPKNQNKTPSESSSDSGTPDRI